MSSLLPGTAFHRASAGVANLASAGVANLGATTARLGSMGSVGSAAAGVTDTCCGGGVIRTAARGT